MDQYRAGRTAAVISDVESANTAVPRYAEVWGDTVDLGHLSWSVVIGIGVSLGAFFAGKSILSTLVADAAIARAYAMLVGLAGCLVAGVMCAFLFKPKRDVVEHSSDESERFHVLEQLAAESGGLGSISDLSAAARAEMTELGILELFASYEASHGQSAPSQRKGERA
jgi:hypothetical protein